MALESYLFTLVLIVVLALWFTLQTYRKHREDCQRLRQAGGSVSLIQLVINQARQVNVGSVLCTLAKLHEADIHDYTFNQLVSQWRAGVDVQAWADAVMIARQHRLQITPERIAELSLEGWDVRQLVQGMAEPWDLEVPDKQHGKPSIDAVAQDGWQVRMRVAASVRYVLERLIPQNMGNGPEVIRAKIGVAAVHAVGGSSSAQRILNNPKLITDAIRAAQADADSFLMIVDIRLTALELGLNIGEMLQAEQREKMRAQGVTEAGGEEDGEEDEEE